MNVNKKEKHMGKNKIMGYSKKVKKLSASKLAEFFRTKSLFCATIMV